MVGDDVISYVQQALDGQMQLALSGAMDKRVFLKLLQISFLDRLQGLNIAPQLFQSC